MHQYETSTTVSGQGEIHLAGVPFTAGTSVEVTIREKIADDAIGSTVNPVQPDGRRSDVFARIRGRNTVPVGPLNREQLHDRQILR